MTNAAIQNQLTKTLQSITRIRCYTQRKLMRCLSVFFLFTAVLCAEMPHLSGVWKADLQQSKVGGGPPPTSYLVVIEQNPVL